MTGTHANRLGKIGELRTESLLQANFDILKRSPDVDGADFLIQEIFDYQKVVHRSTMVRVQSKFRSFNSAAKIPAVYVKNGTTPRTDFFLMIHTGQRESETLRWFFDAGEILRLGTETDGGKTITINIKNKDSFVDQQRTEDEISKIITKGIEGTDYIQSRLQAALVLNPAAAHFVSTARGNSVLSEFSTAILMRLRWADIPLIERLAGFVLYIDHLACVLPFWSHQLWGDGASLEIGLPYEPDYFRLSDKLVDVNGTLHLRRQFANTLQLKEGFIQDLVVFDSLGVEHRYELIEGFGRTCWCSAHPNCTATLLNGTLANVWRAGPTRIGRRSLFDPYLRRGILCEHLSPDELNYLVECGVLRSLESVDIEHSFLYGRHYFLGERTGIFKPDVRGMGIAATALTVLELTQGGAELVSTVSSVPHERYSAMVASLIETIGSA